jgi:hypothetical protein
VLAVTLGHPDDFIADGHELSIRQLLAVATRRANAEHDLVAGAAVLARPSQHAASHGEQRRVVRGLRASPERGQGLPKQRKGLWRDLEAQHVPPRVRLVRRAGIVTGALARNQLLQLANGLAACHLDPCPLVLGDRHSRELAHGRPVQRPVFENLRHRR